MLSLTGMRWGAIPTVGCHLKVCFPKGCCATRSEHPRPWIIGWQLSCELPKNWIQNRFYPHSTNSSLPGRQVYSKNGSKGLQRLKITNQPLPGKAWIQLPSFPEGDSDKVHIDGSISIRNCGWCRIWLAACPQPDWLLIGFWRLFSPPSPIIFAASCVQFRSVKLFVIMEASLTSSTNPS